MTSTYSDADIEALLAEQKSVPTDWRTRLRYRQKRGHEEAELDLPGADGNEFRVILRRNSINRLDFSAILAVRIPESNRLFRLRRYNGKSHEHTNQIEDTTFFDFHIHTATERYQQLGSREDAYAEVTDRFGDPEAAIQCLFDDANCDVPPESQMSLFAEV